MNDSSFRAVSVWMKRTNRHRLLRLRTSLFCRECQQVERVTDFFSGSDIVALSCGHRRDVFERSDKEISAYEAALREHTKRVEIVGKNAANANGYVRTFSEPVEQAVGQC